MNVDDSSRNDWRDDYGPLKLSAHAPRLRKLAILRLLLRSERIAEFD
jgi:hypothetical protein